MKKFKTILATGLMMLACTLGLRAARVVYSQSLVNETALAYANTYLIDMGVSALSKSNIDSLSMQAVYSSATIPTVTFNDGTASTSTITVSSFTSTLEGVQATGIIQVSSNSSLVTGTFFILNGYYFVNGDLWTTGPNSTTTAINIMNAINTYGATKNLFSASTATFASTVTITVISTGAAGNNYTLTSSTGPALKMMTSTATNAGQNFTGGFDAAMLVINGTVLKAGVDFRVLTSSHVTAGNIMNAINASSTTLGVMASTDTSLGVVKTTSTVVGSNKNFGMYSSTNSWIGVGNRGFIGGTDSLVLTATNLINVTNHRLTTGLAVLFSSGTVGVAPANLTGKTTYYAIRVDANNFKLATSSANAIAGTAISISTQNATGGGTFTLAPLGITGTPSFQWQYSNDNANWTSLNVSSVTMTSLGVATTMWDFGSVNYRYIRLNVDKPPTTGGIVLTVTGIGKSSY